MMNTKPLANNKQSCASNQKKNLLIFSWRYIKHSEAGGAEIYLQQIAKRLRQKFNVTIFTARPVNLMGHEQINGIDVVRRGNKFTVYFWAIIYYWLYLRHQTDVVIDVENGIPFFTPLFSRKPKIGLVHHVHAQQFFREFAFPVAILGWLLETRVMPLVYRHVPIVTVSESSYRELASIGIPSQNILIAPNAVHIPKVFRHAKQTRKYQRPTLLYLGRLKKYKRIDLAVQAVEKLIGKYPDLQLLIVGQGNQRDNLENLVQRKRLTKQVKFLGFVSESKKYRLMSLAHLFLMPSLKEGFGVTVLEAAGVQTPSVGFNVPGVNNAILDHQTGLLCDNFSEFVDQVDVLLSNQILRAQLANAGRTWAESFSWDKTSIVFDQLINAELNKALVSNNTYPWALERVFKFSGRLTHFRFFRGVNL